MGVCGVQVQPLNEKEVAVTTGVYVRSGLLGFVGNVSSGFPSGGGGGGGFSIMTSCRGAYIYSPFHSSFKHRY